MIDGSHGPRDPSTFCVADDPPVSPFVGACPFVCGLAGSDGIGFCLGEFLLGGFVASLRFNFDGTEDAFGRRDGSIGVEPPARGAFRA